MKIECFMVPSVGSERRRGPTLTEQRMLHNRGEFDRDIAYVLAFLSAWSYAVPEELAASLLRVGLPGSRCAVLAVTNEVMLLEARAYVVQSEDMRTLLLCFRGTPPFNPTAWASNMQVEFTPFYAGNVHSGFYGTLIAMWPTLAKLLRKLLDGEDLCAAVKQMNQQEAATSTEAPGPLGASSAEQPERRGGPPPTSLYITGHSLGGALAVLAAALLSVGEAMLVEDEALIDLSPYAGLLRGLYTFGQPKVGDAFFAEVHAKKFGDRLFRMIYEHDFVTRLPTQVMGAYEHFGVPYHSSDGGWVRASPAGSRGGLLQSWTQTLIIDTLSVMKRVFPAVQWVGAVQLLNYDDHLPRRYLRTSMQQMPYTELLAGYRATSAAP